jgi:hypothetical protein
MRTQYTLTVPLLATIAVVLIVPALAVTLNGSQTAPGHGTDMGRMDHGTMSRGMMSGGMMGGGCAGMMQSMNGGSERPNSQWRLPDHTGRSMPN